VSKVSKASVNYRRGNAIRHCGNCSMYSDHLCTLVAGSIDPGDVCDRWAAPNVYGEERPLWILRHGATALNMADHGTEKMRGWTDLPLTPKGLEQAKKLAQRMENVGLKVIIASDLLRAKQTAQLVADAAKAELKFDRRLRTWDVGEFAGSYTSVVHGDILKFAQFKPERKIPGGESFCEFKDRVFGALRDMMQKNYPDSLGIVTHRWVERLIKSWIAKGSMYDLTLDFNVMFTPGEGTADADKVNINLVTLFA
jgi:broad specificity phosphatase PhoE